MPDLAVAAAEFLALPRIAVAGVSRRGDTAANVIFRKLRAAAAAAPGRAVFAVNPQTDTVEGGPCHRRLQDIAGGIDGVVIATPPAASVAVVRDAAAAGARAVWIHRGLGRGSASDEAVQLARDLGLAVIPGSCPMMWAEPVEVFHRCLRWWTRGRDG